MIDGAGRLGESPGRQFKLVANLPYNIATPVISMAVEATLKRLGTDRLDVYYVHMFDERTPVEETARAMADLHVPWIVRPRAETDQASRWLAAALLEAEKGFRRIIGHKDLPRLAESLRRRQAERVVSREGPPQGREPGEGASSAAVRVGASPPLRATPSAPSTPQPAKT